MVAIARKTIKQIPNTQDLPLRFANADDMGGASSRIRKVDVEASVRLG
jgi:hypothetical protein